MENQKKSKLISEIIMPQSVLNKNTEALDLYKTTDGILKETIDILEKTAIALGRQKRYEYSFGSTQNCEINHHAVPTTTSSYKI